MATKCSIAIARHYIAGLLSNARRKNMERIYEKVAGVEYQDLQHFLTDSPWDAKSLWKEVGASVSESLGGGQDQMLLIDESAFTKKGAKSAGVARQHNGRLGKVDNCQVGVFSALCHGTRVGLVGARLYLPKDWTNDPRRCEAAGIPESERRFRTKNELALELIDQAEEHGLLFSHVGIDAGYGRDQDLLFKIAAKGKKFVAGVDRDQCVWVEEPQTQQRPEEVKGSGAQTVESLWALNKGNAREIELRTTENGRLKVKFWAKRVWIWPKECEVAMDVWLMVTQQSDGRVKYALSNEDEDTEWTKLAQMHGQRYFIERALEEGKSQLGMAQYQARQWSSWVHHMALVGAAMSFALSEQVLHEETSPLTSVRDVVEMLAWRFERPRTPEAVMEEITARHERRRQAQEAKLRRDRHPPSSSE